ncbi:MAG: RecQ family ATP-dependent DNA helicase [Emticicia sp.]|uniref:RecQ family ATP-dependent DNA helicase n=1 Tax=Emticicia sp. TaxID=1930953 RepID=UPI003BA7C876
MQTPLEILKEFWQYDAFRPLQEDIINSVLAQKDTLALMPTGGGKSICFQVPAMAMEGVCIVITPLVALMKDQVEQLKRRGIKAAAIYSGMHRNEIDYTLDNFVYGDFKFLYVSPERLLTEIMQVRTKMMKVCLLVIDEAHCISQWGYDFRPPYLKIPEFRKFTGNAPTIALTATATKEAQQDIIDKLELKNVQVFQQSFARPNISYSVFCEDSKEKKLFDILQKVQGTAIVYVRSRRRTKEISDWLNRSRISSDFYHAGLSTPERFKKQEAWINNQVRVIVATNAFGMGIDKPDVRVVVHLDLPETLEAYYQEAGRAGRDGKKAYAVLLYTKGDLEDIFQQTEKKYPPIENLKRVYQALANYKNLAVGGENFESYDFDFQEFISNFGFSAHDTHNELKVLEDEGLIQLSDAYYSPSKISFKVDNHELYKFQIKTPSYDKFIKTLLRIYGGDLFTSYVSISEATIGKYFFGSAGEIEKMLDYLQQVGILTYQKQKSIPQLTFLTARQDVKYLTINVVEMQRRKKKALEKVAAVVQFADESRRCRQQFLQEYFNEFTNITCGICDNCLKQKKRDEPIPIEIYTKYRQKILEIIPAPANQIVDYQFFNNKDFVKEVIRKMIENEEIKFSELGIVERIMR